MTKLIEAIENLKHMDTSTDGGRDAIHSALTALKCAVEALEEYSEYRADYNEDVDTATEALATVAKTLGVGEG